MTDEPTKKLVSDLDIRESINGAWVVHAIDAATGEVNSAEFGGEGAEERARAFAEINFQLVQ